MDVRLHWRDGEPHSRKLAQHHPRLVVQDPSALVEFLKQAFGATGEFRTEAPTELRIGDSMLMVSGAGVRKPVPALLYLYIEDTDATCSRALELGAESSEAPIDTPYGDRRAIITDPSGNSWQIATRTGHH